MGICIVARLIGTIGLVYMLTICGRKTGISFRQLLFISYAGMIRGAIAFGLVLRLSTELIHNEIHLSVIRTTALTLVISSTLIFGSTMQIVQSLLVPALNDEEKLK